MNDDKTTENRKQGKLGLLNRNWSHNNMDTETPSVTWKRSAVVKGSIHIVETQVHSLKKSTPAQHWQQFPLFSYICKFFFITIFIAVREIIQFNSSDRSRRDPRFQMRV